MANPEHVAILDQGVGAWNDWRKRYPEVRPDLSGLNDRDAPSLSGRDLAGVDFSRTNLFATDFVGADLKYAKFIASTLQSANLSGAVLTQTDFWKADLFSARFIDAKMARTNLHSAQLSGALLNGATLSNVTLTEAILRDAVFERAKLINVDLRRAVLVHTSFEHAVLRGCRVYGIAAWDLRLEGAVQEDLRIGAERANPIAVDDLEVAQFIHLLLHNTKIRDVIDTVARRGVLILGRFSADRKPTLEAVRGELRRLGFLPIVFDFERPAERDFTETMLLLAGLSLFVVADITNPRASPLELQAAVPNFMVPVVPLLQRGEAPFAMFADLQHKFDWVHDVLVYDTPAQLVAGLQAEVVAPALRKHEELIARKAVGVRIRPIGGA